MNLSIYSKFLSGKKLSLILLNSLNNILPAIATLLISFLVVRSISIEVWGEYARLVLLILILTQISSWGNKEYLIRGFSNNPALINSQWTESIISRSVLLIPLLAFIFLTPYHTTLQFALSLILLFRFIIQSYDSIFFYKRNYLFKITLEFLYGLLFALTVLLFKKKLTCTHLIFLTAALDLAKAMAILIINYSFFKRINSTPKISYLKKSLPFFILGFTSLIASRIDQVNAAISLPSIEMGKYQIIMSFLLIIQASSNYILQPFLKNIYRLKFNTIKKIAMHLFLLGLFIGALEILCMKYILSLFYRIELDSFVLLLCYLFVLPIFYYSVYIFNLFKTENVNFVIVINVVGTIITLALSWLFMKLYEKSFYWILLSTCIVQYIFLFIYTIHGNRKYFLASKNN